MTNDALFFKKKQITEAEVELTFHRDYTWIYNPAPFPVVKYLLIGCKNIEALNWDSMDTHLDGVIIALIDNGDHSIFQTTDRGGNQFEVKCERLVEEEKAYETEDLTDLLKEANRQLDNETTLVNRLQEMINALCHFLEKRTGQQQSKTQ